VLRRDTWGAGLAFEAASAALRAAAAELPDQPVLVVTQTANRRARRLADRLGFRRPAPTRSTTRSRPSPWLCWARSRIHDRRARESAWRISGDAAGLIGASGQRSRSVTNGDICC
jgi:RimJ/RimL family protein N-acetyltransferase